MRDRPVIEMIWNAPECRWDVIIFQGHNHVVVPLDEVTALVQSLQIASERPAPDQPEPESTAAALPE
jgi:hypothetical protein